MLEPGLLADADALVDLERQRRGGVEHLDVAATTSISPVGRSGLALPSARAPTVTGDPTQYSLRRSWAPPVSTSSRTTTWTMPEASRRSRKATPPWSRRRATHPASVTVWPACVGTQGAGLVGAEHGWSFESGATGVA